MTFPEGEQPTYKDPQAWKTWEQMSDPRGSGMIQNLGGQAEDIPPTAVHASDYIREERGSLLQELKRLTQGLAQGMLHFFSSTEIPEGKVGVTDQTVEELPDNAGALIGYFEPGIPLVMEPGFYSTLGKASRVNRVDPLKSLDHPGVQDSTPHSSDPETP